mgnify:CR=1 FL=1
MTENKQELLHQKRKEYQDREIGRVKLGLTDIDGVIRGKYIGVDKFFSLLESQGGFCAVSYTHLTLPTILLV